MIKIKPMFVVLLVVIAAYVQFNPADFFVILFTILLHEMGHMVAYLASGHSPKGIELNGMGIAVRREYIPGWPGVLTSLAGPMVTALFAAAFGGKVGQFNIYLLILSLLPFKFTDLGHAYAAYRGR